MEYADDGDLQAKVNLASTTHRPIPEDTVLTIGAQVIFALVHLHDQGVLHRDIKTANVFLSKSGSAKLGDFGVWCAHVLGSLVAQLAAALGLQDSRW